MFGVTAANAIGHQSIEGASQGGPFLSVRYPDE
jgi:hypothetical protein